ncbi:MAG: DUF393 domain-containing protein [Gammaproteobacteria bacterium]|nr:DUF393 domain-containing protein [Gammaproteobacteria bacterium]
MSNTSVTSSLSKALASQGRDLIDLQKWKTVFSIDLRTLALFRVMLATLVLWDLLLRSFDMKAFYTDSGVLPRKLWVEAVNIHHLSFHAANGNLWWQILLFLAAAFFAFCLFFGYRTRLMSMLTWLMLMSINNRNPYLMQGGDQLIIVMSFWAMFLPIGARWSVDAALQPHYKEDPNNHRFKPQNLQPYFSLATVAVLFQVLYLYFFTALLKNGDAWIKDFDAAFYAVSLQHFATPIGEWIRQFPGFLKLGTVYVLAVEFIAPIIVLLPIFWPWLRIAGLLAMASLHVAFLLMLHIGLFPLIDFMSLSLLIPGIVWVWWASKRKQDQRSGIVIYYDEDCGFCLKMCLILREFLLPNDVKILRAQNYTHIHTIMERENSWVVTDAQGNPYTHWQAMQFLFKQSWPFKPIGWVMSFPPFMKIGSWVYRWVATNRGTMGDITAVVLPYRKVSISPTVIGSLIALFFWYVVTAYNITGVPGNGQYRTKHVEQAIRTTRLDQHWSMFAPKPLTFTLYPQIPGKLRSGETVNLYPLTSTDADWEPPERMYPLYEGYRWRKFIDNVRFNKSNTSRTGFGGYFCKKINTSGKPRNEQLASLEIYFVRHYTNTTGDPKKENRYRAWRHWCFPEYAKEDKSSNVSNPKVPKLNSGNTGVSVLKPKDSK